MKLAWQLRGDVEALQRLLPKPGLSDTFGVSLTGVTGPPVGSSEWWGGIESNTEVVEGHVARVDREAGAFEIVRQGRSAGEYPLRGDPGCYDEGVEVRLVLSYPPVGFVPGSGDADYPGLLIEVWTNED